MKAVSKHGLRYEFEERIHKMAVKLKLQHTQITLIPTYIRSSNPILTRFKRHNWRVPTNASRTM